MSDSQMTAAQKDELMDQVKQLLAISNTQELLGEMTKKCFIKCIAKPGSSLDSSEQKCVTNCMDRFMDSFNVTSRAYTERIQNENYRL